MFEKGIDRLDTKYAVKGSYQLLPSSVEKKDGARYLDKSIFILSRNQSSGQEE